MPSGGERSLEVWPWMGGRAYRVESVLLQELSRPDTTRSGGARDTSMLHLIGFQSDGRLDHSIAQPRHNINATKILTICPKKDFYSDHGLT